MYKSLKVAKGMKITFKEILVSNWKEAVNLKIKSEQKHFLRSNLYTIAWSKFESDGYFLKGIYSSNTDAMVGYTWFGHDPSDNTYWIRHFMIDGDHQGNGYGEAGLRRIIETLKDPTILLPSENPEDSRGKEIYLSILSENTEAKKLFEKVGFVNTGEVSTLKDGDIVLNFEVYQYNI
jgi:diamine N-acetyltransferase